jgi:DNA-directed RNA polymerase specialized sigma24 family protein
MTTVTTSLESVRDEKIALQYRRSHDEALFEELYRRHRGELLAIAERFTGEPHNDLEQVVEEVFGSLREFLLGQKPLEHLAYWLAATLKHLLDTRRQ